MNAAAQVSAVWGAVALVLGLTALVLFRNQIGAAIDRWRGATFGKDRSVDLSGSSPQAQVEAQKEPHKESPDLLPAPQPQPGGLPALPPPNALYEPIEEDLRRRVETAFPGSQDTQIAWALRVAAQATVERNHEQTYRVIFGSQILVLKEINVRSFITAAQAQEIYGMAAAAFPDLYATFPFKNWGGFLIDQGLVVIPDDPVTDESRVHLTPAGKDFLFFLTGRGLPENKGG
jgi:hypothetical protein